METVDTLILGAGLAGLSSSYHIGHNKCLILEAKSHAFGHIHSEVLDGFTWDEGPHVSFTKHAYVKELFSDAVNDNFEEYEPVTGNYYHGDWINHPAQSNLYQISEPLRTKCLDSFLSSREKEFADPVNYDEWLQQAFGAVFAETFPRAYTKKYWTVDPKQLTTDWVGQRVFRPSIDDVINGSNGPLSRNTHYIKKVRYPSEAGYQSFAQKLAKDAKIHLNTVASSIDLLGKIVTSSDGRKYKYNQLINTIPLPLFLECCQFVPKNVAEASNKLLCSSIQLVNVTAPHETQRPENWIYVYDEDKFAVRINCTEKLARGNAPIGSTGVQVEVYHSPVKPLKEDSKKIERAVVEELVEMGLICPEKVGGRSSIKSISRMVPWANIIFDHNTRPSLSTIFDWLQTQGLRREADDLHPLTNWDNLDTETKGDLILAGRFGQWKYFWTDDCVLRGKHISESIRSN
ncbi:FAD-dependent oxidoreductase [bacterium]|nr:FAD-dependent oxidoreductase [bacterium]